jgi:hypothetical protein
MTTKSTERKSVFGETRILRIAERVFVPLAHLFADHGVTCPQAERLLRAVCVREAAVTEAKTRKKPNISRIALLTGLDRKEVARLLSRPPRTESRLEARSHPGDRVLEGWHSDRTFARKGRPLALSIKASRSKLASFWSLASRYAPGVYPGLLLRELLRVGAVEALRDGRVRARTRRIEPWERGSRRAGKPRAYLHGVLRPLVPEAHGPGLKTQQRTQRR